MLIFALNALAASAVETTDRLVVTLRSREAPLSLERRRDVAQALSARAAVSLRALHATSQGGLVLALDRRRPLAEVRRLAHRLALDADVLDAEPDVFVRTHAVAPQAWPNDSYGRAQWALDLGPGNVGGADFLAAWPYLDANAPPVTVAVIDSGVLPHPDLVAHLIPGRDFVTDLATAGDGDARDADATDPGDWCEARGWASSWHGTSTASLIAAVANNGRGIAGAAPNAQVLAVRALGHCGGWSSDIADAIAWAAGADVPGAPPNTTPAQVISLSLGAPHACPRFMQAAIDQAAAHGAIVVASAGNDAAAGLDSPGNCAGVIAVGAHTRSGDLASYSNHAASLALTAPAGGPCLAQAAGDCDGTPLVALGNQGTTLSAGWLDERPFTGTSAAVPQVAAAVALLRSARADLKPAQARSALATSARSHPIDSWCARAANAGQCGAGMLDAMGALAQLRAPLLSLEQPRGYVAGASPVALSVTIAGGRPPYAIRWRQLTGAPLALQGADGAELRFTAPATRQDGDASFEVEVTGSDGFATRAVAVVQVDNAPRLRTGDAQAATGGPLILPIEIEDADGDATTLELLAAPAGARIEGRQVVWPDPLPGRHAFTLLASDGRLDSAPATFHIDVQGEPASALAPASGDATGGGALDLGALAALAVAALSARRASSPAARARAAARPSPARCRGRAAARRAARRG